MKLYKDFLESFSIYIQNMSLKILIERLRAQYIHILFMINRYYEI